MLNSNLFTELFYQSKLPQAIASLDMKYCGVNQAFCNFLGYKKDELEGFDVSLVSEKEDYERNLLLIQMLLNGEIDECEIKNKFIHRNGSFRVGCLKVSLIKDNYGEGSYILGQIFDITDKMKLEEELRKSEEKYRLLAEHSSDIINLHGLDGKYKYVSPSVKAILGYDENDFQGKVPSDFIHPDETESVSRQIGELFYFKAPVLSTYRARKKDGSYIWVESAIKAIFDQKGEISQLISVSRDIQQRIETTNLLRKSEKLAVVGQMAAAVAHEIRNPLTPIKGFIQMAESGVELHPAFNTIILNEIDRIEKIISEFLNMAKPHSEKKEIILAEELVQQIIHFLMPQAMMKNKEINFYEGTKKNSFIYGDRNSLKQVFINIIQNALDAIEEQGIVDISIRDDSGQVYIDIKDNGCGIPENRLKKMGEPFYSTKERGTGLGLMTSFRIIEQHNGTIKFDSIEDEGTTVIVSLPNYISDTE